MFIALDINGNRIDISNALKGNDYFCPVCNNPLRIKEGKIKIKHFAHISKVECDDFTSDMSEWHRSWQEQFPLKNREVVIEHNGEKHRADVLAYGHVIEFQHSSISLHEFERRNKFYTSAGKKVVWIFDFIEKHSSNQMRRFDQWQKGDIKGGQWCWNYSTRLFKNFAPQEETNVVLIFQTFDRKQKEFYLERVIWADRAWNGTSFREFKTIYFPQTKEELLDWIKNRNTYDSEENLVLRTPVIKPKKKTKPLQPIQTAIQSPSIPKATTITLEREADDIPREEFNREIILKDKDGVRILLCTKCNQVFPDAEMSDYQYSKGICKACMRKKSKES